MAVWGMGMGMKYGTMIDLTCRRFMDHVLEWRELYENLIRMVEFQPWMVVVERTFKNGLGNGLMSNDGVMPITKPNASNSVIT